MEGCFARGVGRAGGAVFEVFARQSAQCFERRAGVEADGGGVEHALTSVENRFVAGAAAQVACQIVGQLLARWSRIGVEVAFITGRQRHHNTRCAVTALRGVGVDQCALDGVQSVGGGFNVFDRKQRLAVECRQEPDAGIDRLQMQRAIGCGLANNYGAGTAIAFSAAFLGTGAACVLTQPLQYRAGCCGTFYLDNFAIEEEPDRPCRFAWCHQVNTSCYEARERAS